MDLLWQNPNETAQINCDDSLESIANDISRLKASDTVRRICLSSSQPQQSEAKSKSVVELVMDLLRTNVDMQCLKMYGADDELGGVQSFLFEALANGEAGDNLEYLDVTPMRDGSYGALPRYLTENSHLRGLRLFLSHDDPATLQVVFSLVSSSVTSLFLIVNKEAPWLEELGGMLPQCTSISGLGLKLYASVESKEEYSIPEAFLVGIANMPSLTKLMFDAASATGSLIASIKSLVLQHGSLESLTIRTNMGSRTSTLRDKWVDLVSQVLHRHIRFSCQPFGWLRNQSHSAQRGMSHVKCLNTTYVYHHQTEEDFASICSTVAQLPEVESVEACFFYLDLVPDWAENSFLDMVKTSGSVLTRAELRTETASSSSSFREQVVDYCVFNKVRSTMLGQANLSCVWPHVLSNMGRRSDGASLVYRLLREKPELVPRVAVSRKRRHEDMSS